MAETDQVERARFRSGIFKFVSTDRVTRTAARAAVCGRAALACFFVGLLALGCDDDDDALCAQVCQDVVAANCSPVPLEQSDCEASCIETRSGDCRDEHDALLSCGGDELEYVCNPNDSMTVAGCESEYDALDACLNQP